MQTANHIALKSVCINCITHLEMTMPIKSLNLSNAQSTGLIKILSKHTSVDDRDADMFLSDDSGLLDEIQLALFDDEVSCLHMSCYAAQLIAICTAFNI